MGLVGGLCQTARGASPLPPVRTQNGTPSAVRRSAQFGGVTLVGCSTGAHLHCEVRKNDQALNPFPFIRESRADVFQQARNGRGKELLAQYRQGLQKGTARR